MKKQRGLKRYYRNLKRQNEFDKITWLNLWDTSTWPKNWHLHFDWRGYGDNSFKRRKPQLDKLFRHFSFLVEETKSLKSEFQLYAVILDFHSQATRYSFIRLVQTIASLRSKLRIYLPQVL